MTENRLRTLIVDDEPIASRRMRILCDDIPEIDIVGMASEGAAAVANIESLVPDLVLLDIAMPGLDGLAVARAVETMPARPAIIFCTAHDQHAIAAFDVSATDYLLKPVNRERLLRSVGRVRDKLRVRATIRPAQASWMQDLWVPYRDGMTRIVTTDIDRIEAERDYMRIRTGTTSYLLHETITRLATRLDPALFIRLRRSVIVRRALIRSLRHDGLGVWTAMLQDGTEIRVGPTFLSELKIMLLVR